MTGKHLSLCHQMLCMVHFGSGEQQQQEFVTASILAVYQAPVLLPSVCAIATEVASTISAIWRCTGTRPSLLFRSVFHCLCHSLAAGSWCLHLQPGPGIYCLCCCTCSRSRYLLLYRITCSRVPVFVTFGISLVLLISSHLQLLLRLVAICRCALSRPSFLSFHGTLVGTRSSE